jgi:ComF family protein
VRRFGLRWSELRDSLVGAEQWLLPGSCLLCDEEVRDDSLICDTCCQRFSRLPHPQCRRCGQPLSPGIDCRLCTAWPARFDRVQSAVWLDDGARRAVHLFKYDGWRRIADAMAGVIAGSVAIPRQATLIPIPLSAGRERTRGYNQSAVLAEAVATRLGVRVVPALRRGRDTGTQTALTPEARRANLAGAFAVCGTPPVNPVLVDDVFTTGATLAEAAQALLTAGAAQVSGVTFARAVRPLADAVASLSSR